MALKNIIRRTVQRATGRGGPRLLTVRKAWRLTPNMIRVTLTGEDLESFPQGHEGGNCKLLLPTPAEPLEAFKDRLQNGPAPIRRTYTVRHFRAADQELDIDFVAHGDSGPAAAWANHAQPGDFIGFMGPSAPKVAHFEADWYLVAADPSAIPVAACALEAMPRDAKGVAVFEIPSPDDRQDINAPDGVDVHWLVQPDPHTPAQVQPEFLDSVMMPAGRIQTCIAGESGVVKQLKTRLHQRAQISKKDTYISGYWKSGLIEDEHQKHKRLGL